MKINARAAAALLPAAFAIDRTKAVTPYFPIFMYV